MPGALTRAWVLTLVGCTQSVTLGTNVSQDAATDSADAREERSAPCDADDVTIWGSSICARYVWNGETCVIVRGCDCSGACERASDTYLACMDLHATCWPSVCDDAHACPAGYYCARAACSAVTGTCAAIPTDGCVLATPEPTCGCDGIVYASRCDAALASQSIANVCLDAGV